MPFGQIKIYPEFLEYWHFKRFHKLNERPVGIGNVSEVACSFAHVEHFGLVRLKAVNRKREPCGLAFFPSGAHAAYIKTKVNESQVTPETVLKDLPGGTIEHLHQFELCRSQQFTETALF